MRLAYLLSLYRDLGTVGCALGIARRAGHYGHSEISCSTCYHGTTGYWLLDQAVYSAHVAYNVYPRLFAAYPGMNYPGRPGGYPRAFLSLRKHAGYRSDRECDAGELGLDECATDTRVRVVAGAVLHAPPEGLPAASLRGLRPRTSGARLRRLADGRPGFVMYPG